MVDSKNSKKVALNEFEFLETIGTGKYILTSRLVWKSKISKT